LIEVMTDCLGDRDPAIPEAAAVALAALGAPAEGAVPRLVQALSSDSPRTRGSAAYALGVFGAQPEAVIPELCALLGDEDSEVVRVIAGSLAQFGTRAEQAAPRLLDALTAALVECDGPLIDALADGLLTVAADPNHHVRQHLGKNDPELRNLVLATLKERQELARQRQGTNVSE
jgi:HEAT repeat protein